MTGAAGPPLREWAGSAVPLVLAVACALVASCRGGDQERGRPPTARSVAHTPPRPLQDAPVSLEETVGRLRELHQQRRYAELEAFIDPRTRISMVNTLMAMDQFLAANDELLAALGRQLDPALLPQWDLSAWAEAQGIFAPRVRVVSATDDGRSGTVTFQVGERLPLEEADFLWSGDRWSYQPGPDVRGLASAVRELAGAVSAVARRARRETLSPQAVDEEFRLGVVPRLTAIQQLAAAESRASAARP